MYDKNKNGVKSSVDSFLSFCDQEHMARGKRGPFNVPRNVAIYPIMQLRSEKQAEICREYGLNIYS